MELAIRQPKVIVFDLDATLVDMISDYAIRMFFDFAKKEIIGLTPDKIKECYGLGFAKWNRIKDTLEGRNKYLRLWEFCFRNITNRIDSIRLAYDFQKKLEENCLDKLYPDVISTLQILYNKKFKLGIFSERTSSAIKNCINRHNLHYFDFYISASDLDLVNTKSSNYAWQILIKKISEMDFTEDEILYIGDDYKTDINGYKYGITTLLINRKQQRYNTKFIDITLTNLDKLLPLVINNGKRFI
jgi:FMN phosphatase YigB (HAD superfamily)